MTKLLAQDRRNSFAVAVVQKPFEVVLDFCRGYLASYYDEMCAERPEGARGFEYWGEAARWMEPFANTHLEGATIESSYRNAGLAQKAAEDLASYETDMSPAALGCDLWGEVRVVEPTNGNAITLLDFPSREFDWQIVNLLPIAIDTDVFTFRCYGPTCESDPIFAEFLTMTPRGMAREVRLDWQDIVRPKSGHKPFRQSFEANGKPRNFETLTAYDAKFPRDRLSKSILFKMMDNLSSGLSEAVSDAKVNRGVLFSGRPVGRTLVASAEVRSSVQNAIKKYRSELSPYLHKTVTAF